VKKSLLAVMIFLALYLALGVVLAMAQQQKQEGGYQKAPKNDPAIIAAANFAVNEQKKETGTISLASIKRAETQLVAGINYRLCLRFKVDGKSRTATAVVNKTLDDRYTLTSWEPGGCKKH
jgi:hypothetical protein